MTRPKRPAFCAKCGAELEYEGRTPYCACGLRESECECEASAAANPAALKVECPDGRHILCISEIERIRALEVDVAKERSLAEQATRARRALEAKLELFHRSRESEMAKRDALWKARAEKADREAERLAGEVLIERGTLAVARKMRDEAEARVAEKEAEIQRLFGLRRVEAREREG